MNENAITNLEHTNTGFAQWIDADGTPKIMRVLGTDCGYAIGNIREGGQWVAVQVADFEDDAECYEAREGDEFETEGGFFFRAERTDNAGSIEWVCVNQ